MSTTIIVCRWIGRILSLVLAVFIALLTVYILGASKRATSPTDIFGATMMICFVIGLAISWPFELAGIILSYAGLGAIIIMMLAMHERDILNLWYCAIPTTILLVCRIAKRKQEKQA